VPRRPARLVVSTAVAAAALAGLSACNPMAPAVPSATKPAPAKPNAPVATNPATAYEARILVLVNAERAKKGLRPLAMIACADSYANSWASTMARTGSFQHQSLTPILKACAARAAGENIAYGNISADQMMTNWMNSPGHRANILNGSFTHIGIGAVKTSSGRWYGVQDFVRR
jgi:uncharacterized protein YkwD